MRPRTDNASALFTQASQVVRDIAGLECEPTAWRSPPPTSSDFDGMARLRFREMQTRQPYVVKRSLNSTVIHLLALLKRNCPDGLLLVTTHVNERQAGVLRNAGIHFIDVSGNVFLDASGFYLSVSGRRMTRPAVASDGARAFHASGVQLLFALLADPRLDSEHPGTALVDQPYRDISATTGISRSTIGWIMADLIRQKFVTTHEDGTRHLSDRKRILERWVQGYAERLRPGLVLERYRPRRGDWWKVADLEGGLWSGEVAAALLTGQLKPGTATIFGPPPSHAFVLSHDLQKDPLGTVEFLKPFWTTSAVPPAASPCAHPLLVYADLMTMDDDRTREAAQAVYDLHLRSIIETA